MIFGVMAVTLAVGGGVTFTLFRNHLIQQQDNSLEDKLRFIRASSVQMEGRKIGFQVEDDVWEKIQRPDNPLLYHMRFTETGADAFKSLSLEKNGLPQPSIAPLQSGEPVFEDITLPTGRPGRMISAAFAAPKVIGDEPPADLVLSVARSQDSIMESVSRLRDFLVRGGIIATGLLLVISYFIVRRNLRPLDQLAEQISKIPVVDASKRFELHKAPVELNPVLDRLNDLMFRFDKVVENERAFTTNAAHELRNPLAAMRSQLELALSKARTTEDYEKTLKQVLEVETRLQSSVENLLLLSRLQSTEPGAAAREFQLVEFDFPRLLRRSWKPHFDRAEEKALQVSWEIDPHIPTIKTSERLVELVIRNLFDNAVSYTEPGNKIRVKAAWKDGKLVFAVENSNPGLTKEELEKMLGRFWRADPARHGEHLHAGIGLGLCTRIAEVLEGDISPSLTRENMLRMTFTLPPECAPPPDVGHPTTRLYIEPPVIKETVE